MTKKKADSNARMYTVHGRKKYQGQWLLINGSPALAYTECAEGKDRVVGYTTLNEILQMAFSPGLEEIKL